MQRWEYRVLPVKQLHVRAMELAKLEKREFYKNANAMNAAVHAVLNELGEEGWELVAALAVERISFAGSGGADCELYFKRPRD